MATELNFHGIKAIAFHSENNRDGSAIGILEEFKKEDGELIIDADGRRVIQQKLQGNS